MKRKGTAMQKTAQNSAISAMLALGLLAFPAQSEGNPWNPFPAPPQAGAAAAQANQIGLARQAPIVQPQSQPAVPSRFAPSGLEQQLAAAPFTQYAPASGDELQTRNGPALTSAATTGAGTGAFTAPPTYAPTPQGNAGGTGYAPPGFGYAPQGYGGYGYAPNPNAPGYSQGPGYAGYPQPYGGYPGGYNNYGNQGFGGNAPFSPFGFPGGTGGFNPFPGNLTNGGIPGFNVSPFGFF